MSEMQGTQVQSLGQEDPLEEGMATHASIPAWRIPKDRGAWWLAVHGVAKSQTQLTQIGYQAQKQNEHFSESSKEQN